MFYRMKRRPQDRKSAFLCWLGQCFTPNLHILRDALQPLAGGLRPHRDCCDVGESVGMVGLFAKFLKKGMDFGEEDEHLAAKSRLQKDLFVWCATQQKPRGNTPI